MTRLLPVIDILNNLITVNNFLMASQALKLPKAVTDNPDNEKTVHDFREWKQTIWQSYFEGLLNAQIVPQADEINQLYNLQAATQEGIQGILFEEGNPVPIVIAGTDQLAKLLAQGEPILGDLKAIAESIKHADEKEVAEISKTVKQLNESFDQDQQKFNQTILSAGTTLIATVVDVSIDIAAEEPPIKPLIQGVTQIGKDVITEIKLTRESIDLLEQLEDQWAALDAATAELAQMRMVVDQIDQVVQEGSFVFDVLSRVAADWQRVASVAKESHKRWVAGGSDAMEEWAARMSLAGFSSATMQLAPTT
ncbi:MAG: hypothetical protein QNK37_00370 [Acidobacteriota bacterium]|nr:hypothetical protein [Acidobacteriota bacterium]